MGYLHDFAFSFRVQRDVLVVDRRIGGLQLLLRMAILVYVFWSMSSSFMYLEQSKPHYCNSPFTDEYKYLDSFDGESHTYPDIKCVRMPSSEVLPVTVTVTVTSRSLNLSQSLTARW